MLPRVMRQLSSERALAVFTILLSRLSELDVVRTPSKQLDADLFMDCCIPPLVTVVREVPLRIVNALLRVLLERNSLVDIAKSRIGLAIVTMLLGRAESVKGQTSAIEAGPHGLPSEQDLQIWSELYDYIFASLNGQLSSLFPPAGDRSLEQRAEQDTYVWQFLAAMAVGATTVDHQRSLVLDVRLVSSEMSR